MTLPDITIINTLNTALEAVRSDYVARENADQIERSFLYLCFNGLSLGNYVVFDNLKSMVLTTPKDPNHIEIKPSYDKNSNKAPFIYVTLGSEIDKNNSLGIGEGDNPELEFDNTSSLNEYKRQFSRRFSTTYYIVIGGENKAEVVVLYELFKAILTICINHLTIEKLENIRIGGQDIKSNISIPDVVFMRSIAISFEYDQVVPELAFTEIIKTIRLYWRPEGAISSKGPIIIINEETDDDSSS